MARKRVIYQSEALFVGPTGFNFTYVTGAHDAAQYNAGTATAANRQGKTLNTFNFTEVSTTGVNNINVTNGAYNNFFTGTLIEAAFNSGIQNNILQLDRVQSANYSFEVARQDVNQYGNLAAIDRIILEQPTVSLEVNYYLNSGANEQDIGLTLSPTRSMLADILTGGRDTKNYYILVSPEGTDANVDTSRALAEGNVIGISNGFLTSYTMDAAVGEIPSATINVEGLNMRFYGAASGYLATVNPQDGSSLTGSFRIPTPVSGLGFSALRPGDIQFAINGTRGLDNNDLKIQSASLSVELSREDIQKLGNKFAFTKELTFPITATMSVDAIIGDMTAGNLADVLNDDSAKYDIDLTINQPGVTPTKRAMKFSLKGSKLDSQSFSSSIGDNKSVSLEFSSQIGGPTDLTNGIFIEGSA
jgi:hypothetical protein